MYFRKKNSLNFCQIGQLPYCGMKQSTIQLFESKSQYRTYFFSNEMEKSPRYDTYFSIQFGKSTYKLQLVCIACKIAHQNLFWWRKKKYKSKMSISHKFPPEVFAAIMARNSNTFPSNHSTTLLRRFVTCHPFFELLSSST